jgi:ACS family sodium-dependent inorganic phosphate cotransporter
LFRPFDDQISKYIIIFKAPPLERSRMVGFARTGNYVGIMVSMPVSGILASDYGWQWVFYFFGSIGLVWFAVWISIVKRSPEYDLNMSDQERKFILNCLKSQTTNKKVAIPWKSIFKSTAVWAIIIAQLSEGWGFFTLQTQLPQFLNDVLKFNLANTGYVSSIPYFLMVFMLPISGNLADWVQIKGYLTTKQTRRYFNTFAFIVQAISLLMAVFILKPFVSVFFISCGVAFAAFAYTSFGTNYLDIAPQFAGSIASPTL